MTEAIHQYILIILLGTIVNRTKILLEKICKYIGLCVPQVLFTMVPRYSKPNFEYFRVFCGSHGVQNVTGRVGSRGFQIPWVGLGRVKSFSNITGRVGSGQKVMKLTGRVRS